jgi:hypothetical protein
MHRADARKATPGRRRRLSRRSRVALRRSGTNLGSTAQTSRFYGLVEDEVQDDQYDQRDAKQPAEKVRHDVISFRIEV